MALKFREALARLSRKSYDLEAAPPADVLDCALGCNSMGAPPRVVEAGRGFDYSRLHLTPETSYSKLKKAIVDFWSERADLTTDNVKVANGSIVLMSRLNKLFIENGARVLGYAPQFPEYPAEVMVLGGVYEAVDLEAANKLKFDPQAFISRLDSGQTMAYLDNPNNPSGQLIDLGDIEAIVRAAQEKDILVIVDEAYGDYISEDHSAVNLLDRYDNLTVTRTFSKGFGIGQFRVGYALMPAQLGELYSRVELPFSVSELGATMARTAIEDQEFILQVRRHVREVKARLVDGLRDRGLIVPETHPDCPIFLVGSPQPGADLHQKWLDRSILTTAGQDFAPLDRSWVRINVPLRADDFLSRLED
ncbi:MAG: histidinol-phosphate aminotransferase family protein [Deltaproteobacteria bacterium]|nr:histidinol-phosphate aminotransferase family protein [Deltaproteobacteria bacterium]